jgi:hypothetical protein
VLPIVLNGVRETLRSCAQYSRMGPALRLRSSANRMAWATLSLDGMLTITLIWPNMLLRAAKCLYWAKPNTSNVLPIVLNGSKETLISGVWYARMGPALCLGSAADLMAWATLSSKRHCISHGFAQFLY